ncbi:hypothetical protein [Collinsella sp. UBA1693]|uniref:hypothetical protein n=1 Tax=Collinsella sp. UBA1693 TaxID=1946385 RepID=UPI00257EF78B|nr:hypothetical protein [Collinsella sp. UBA1693]
MNDTNAQVDETRDEEREPTSAEVLRERRNAAIGGKAVDNDIHFSLPLTKVFPVLLVGAVLSYLASSMGSKLGNQMLFYGGRWACSLLFVAAVVVWFVSRSQAKKITAQRNEEKYAVAREIAQAKQEKAQARAAKKRKRRRK